MRPPDSPSSLPSAPSVTGAALSSLVPGLGHWVRGYRRLAARALAAGVVFGGLTWGAVRLGGAGAGMLFVLLVVAPWWCLQAYEAFLPHPRGFADTLKTAWRRAHDIHYLGGLFLWTAAMDLFIILANPDYRLTVFCAKPEGIPGILAKAQSPMLHALIGYGFLTLRPWAFAVYMVYAGYGLVNAAANFACFGYGRIRTVFVLSLAAFTAYVVWRRACFAPASPIAARRRMF